MNRHLLVITSDQHAPGISGFAGDPIIRTPNLDRLADSGVVYENHYCNNPVCTPGRYSMLTGQMPRDNGTLFFEDVLPSNAYTYMNHFSKSGYMTTCVGKMHFHGQDQMHGWMFRPYGDMEMFSHELIDGYTEEYDVAGGMDQAHQRKSIKYEDYGGYTPYMLKTAGVGNDQYILFDLSVTRESIIHLKNYFKGVMDQKYLNSRPLLFQVSFKTPHCPFVAPKELFDYYRSRITKPEKDFKLEDMANLPQEIKTRHWADEPSDITSEMILDARAAYYALIEFMDQQIGEIIGVLEELGVYDKFNIMYTSDHGEMAGEHGLWQKGCFYEDSVRVPMIISGADVPQKQRVKINTSHLDLFPTMCELTSLDTPKDLPGESMLSLLKTERERPIFSEWYSREGDKRVKWEMVKLGSFKYINYNSGSYQLFNLEQDPGERINLINRSEYKDVINILERCLNQLNEVTIWNFT